MEELKKWALGVCAAAIFSSVVYALVPKGNMQKIMRCVAAAVVICALVFPLANALLKTDFSLDSSDTETLIPSGLNDEVNYRITAAYAQQMQDCVEQMEQEGVGFYLNGKKTAPREIIRTCCMREKAVYMPDFVMDEEGKLCEVRYDEVTKW